MLSIIAVLAVVVAAQATPAPASALDIDFDVEFSIPAVHNPDYVRNGTAAMLKAYAKHYLTPTREMPEAFMSALHKRQDGSVSAEPSGGAEYLIPVTVGGEQLNLDLDTGSADLWVFSSLQPASQRRGHAYYTSSDSSTYQALSGSTWNIQYADRSGASGVAGTDTVTVGGTTVLGQCVELAKTVSSSFVSDASDGLIGMAFSNINTVRPQQQRTFFDNAKDSLDSPLFAAYLPANEDGSYDFGSTDPSKYTGNIQYTSVDSSNGFWEYSTPHYKVGSTIYSQSGYTGISDTGTTLLLMGDNAVDNYYAQVSSAEYDSRQGGYVFNCSESLPTLSISIGYLNFATIPGSLLNFAYIGNGQCFGGLQSVGAGGQNIYGDVFFNANYGVFDASGPSFGFAPLN
ncbi:Aspergillopepsin-1 [Hyphodiscus hymeniophilus]|uniref:Aspergillopepsin-1 n=1 Tax=Hyphodiscus hymeniophilus TaxID=353542 RepID=A0A9P6VLS2_9HELO|nr:Aspergillopepsin-1 [Hyphodiscus hymeniophilus]